MRMSSGALAQTTAGQVVNLLSNDVNRFDYAFIYTHFIWLLPLQVVIVCYLIYIKIGYAAIIGVVGIVLQTIPVQCKFVFVDLTKTLLTCTEDKCLGKIAPCEKTAEFVVLRRLYFLSLQ